MPVHYHIRWSGPVPLDWKCYSTAEEAESGAKQLAKLNETYRIAEFDSDCVRCKRPSADSLREVLAQAIKKGHADFGTLQSLDTETGELLIVAQQGFSPRFHEFFHVIRGDSSSCSTTLRCREQVLSNDVLTDPVFKSRDVLEVMRDEGVRSVQSLPLITSGGQLVGVINVHYRAPNMPSIPVNHLELTFIRDVADHLDQFIRSQGRNKGQSADYRALVILRRMAWEEPPGP